MDHLQQLSDDLLLHILDLVPLDLNALFRLRTLSRRFNSLIIKKTRHLHLKAHKLDKIFHTDLGSCYSYYSSEFASNIVSAKKPPMLPATYFLNRNVFPSCFNHVAELVVGLPAVGDMKSSLNHEGNCIYKATFGKNAKSCAILYYPSDHYCEPNMELGLSFMCRKMQVMFVLLNKCAYMAMNLVPHMENLVSLVVKDTEGNLEMVMDMKEIRKCREKYREERVVMPSAWCRYRLRMKCIDNGEGLGKRTMVLGVAVGSYHKKFDDVEEACLARRAFGSGVHGMAIENLLQNSDYIDSFAPAI